MTQPPPEHLPGPPTPQLGAAAQPAPRSAFESGRAAPENQVELPLFPLGLVLFPGGLLPLKIFEPRYLDLMSRCLRDNSGFGVVALREGAEAGLHGGPTLFEKVGVVATLQSVDTPGNGQLFVQALGSRRFRMSSFQKAPDGLWLCKAEHLPDDASVEPTRAQRPVVEGLQRAVGLLAAQDAYPFAKPYRYDDAGWVANRWCELLPVSLAVKQRLMETADPLERLDRVFGLLQASGNGN
jgi:uncharacterized protein